MKTHAIIPVFIPHKGCPNDCVFCNQKAITARGADIGPKDVKNLIESYLPTLQDRNLKTIEIAFFRRKLYRNTHGGAVSISVSGKRI